MKDSVTFGWTPAAILIMVPLCIIAYKMPSQPTPIIRESGCNCKPEPTKKTDAPATFEFEIHED